MVDFFLAFLLGGTVVLFIVTLLGLYIRTKYQKFTKYLKRKEERYYNLLNEAETFKRAGLEMQYQENILKAQALLNECINDAKTFEETRKVPEVKDEFF